MQRNMHRHMHVPTQTPTLAHTHAHMCTHMHTVHTHVHTLVHTETHAHAHTQVCPPNTHTCTQVDTYPCPHTHVHPCANVCSHKCTPTQAHMQRPMDTHRLTHLCTQTHAEPHTCTGSHLYLYTLAHPCILRLPCTVTHTHTQTHRTVPTHTQSTVAKWPSPHPNPEHMRTKKDGDIGTCDNSILDDGFLKGVGSLDSCCLWPCVMYSKELSSLDTRKREGSGSHQPPAIHSAHSAMGPSGAPALGSSRSRVPKATGWPLQSPGGLWAVAGSSWHSSEACRPGPPTKGGRD